MRSRTGPTRARGISLKEGESRVAGERGEVIEKDVLEDIKYCNKEKGRDGATLLIK